MDLKYLKTPDFTTYNGLTFDHTNYITTSSNHIYKLDLDFLIIKTYETIRNYTQIYFDNFDNCFYAISKSSPHKIFKLDENFNEVDFFLLDGYILSISFNPFKNILYFTKDNTLYSFNKNGDIAKICELLNKLVFSISFYKNHYAICYIKNSKYLIELFDYEHKKINEFGLLYSPEQIILTDNELIILCSKTTTYSYILNIPIDITQNSILD